MSMRVGLAAFAVGFLIAGTVLADEPLSPMYTPTDVYGYLTMATAADEFAMQASRLALQRSRNEAVKAYAREVIAVHEAAERAMLEEARRAGLRPQTPLLTGQLQRRWDALAAVEAARFDGAYLAAQYEVQLQAMAAHRTFAERGDNAILRVVAATAAEAAVREACRTSLPPLPAMQQPTAAPIACPTPVSPP